MMHHCRSRAGGVIRLTSERWEHITEGHPEIGGRLYDVLEALETADSIHEGPRGELLALKPQPDGKNMVVVYNEQRDNGFIITAFLTRRPEAIKRRKQTWPK